jgi:hypothetical protein
LPSVTLEKYAAAATLTIAEPAWDEKIVKHFGRSEGFVSATDAGQLNFRFAALAKARIESISRLICASKAAGVIGIGSMPCCASFSCTPGAATSAQQNLAFFAPAFPVGAAFSQNLNI